MTLFQWVFGTLCPPIALRHAIRIAHGDRSCLGGNFWGLLSAGEAVTISRPCANGELATFFGIGRGADLVMYPSLVPRIMVPTQFYGGMSRLEKVLAELVRPQAIKHPKYPAVDS